MMNPTRVRDMHEHHLVGIVDHLILLMRRPPRSALSSSSAASDVYKRQPMELKNVYDDPAYAEVVRDLKAELRRLQEKVGDEPYAAEA